MIKRGNSIKTTIEYGLDNKRASYPIKTLQCRKTQYDSQQSMTKRREVAITDASLVDISFAQNE